MTGLISGADVARLDCHALPAILNALLTVEADLRSIPLTDLDLTLRITVPDAGIDGRIVWPQGIAHDVLLPGTTVVQYKSGALKTGDVAKEFKKEGVQEALMRPDGQYILFVSHDHVEVTRAKHRNKLKELCTALHIDPGRCTILHADQIARWISRFTAVVIRPELGKGYPALATVEQWGRHPNLQNPFKHNPERDEIVAQLRSFARRDSGNGILRVEGHAGVGKTRLALEALRVRGLAERSLYCVNSDDPNVLQLLARLQADTNASAVIVLDECDRDLQETFHSYADLAGGRLRLICVGQAEKILRSSSASGPLYQLTRLPDEEMRSIVNDFEPGAPPEILDVAIRLSGGMPKLAIFVVSVLSKQNNPPLTVLLEIPDVGYFLGRFVDKDTFDTLKGLSLLAKVGWEDELGAEAEKIAQKVLDLPFVKMQKAVKALRDQGVVMSRGKYLYVTPDLLAISAATALWDERGSELIDIIAELPGPLPRKQLLRRIASMADFPSVRLAVERLLSAEGLYKSIADLDQEFLSEVFRYLAAALPEEAQVALDRIFGITSDERLETFSLGRRDVMWALESLLRWPETSIRAARIVRRLALTENEKVSNNATGIFQQYFHAFLSGSPVPLGERLQLVGELLEGNAPAKRSLAVKAAAGALAFHESRMGDDVDAVSQRRYPTEWKPKTWGELWDGRRIAIRQLSLIAEGEDDAAGEARETLYGSVFALLRFGQAKDAVLVLQGLPPKNDKERRELIDSAQRLLGEASEVLDDDERSALEKMIGDAFGAGYFGRLRRWIGRRANGDYDLAGGTGYQAADLKVAELAVEGFARGISDEEMAWLASGEAEHVWVFGRRLGEMDKEKLFLNRIVSATPGDLNCIFLSSYISGLLESLGTPAVEDILDHLESANPVAAFVVTWRVKPDEKGGMRIVRLMELGRVGPGMFGTLPFGPWIESIPITIAGRIVGLMLEGDPAITNVPAVTILERITRTHPDALAEMEPLVWRALESARVCRGTGEEWRWGELAGRVAAKAPARTAQIVLDRLEVDDSPLIRTDPLLEVLSKATTADPEAVWPLVGESLLRSDMFGFRLRLALQKWYGELIPANLLVEWARGNQPDGPMIAAQIVIIAAPMPERARSLATAFPENPKILNIFAGNLQSGGFWGPISAHLERLLDTVRRWEREPDQRIKDWAHHFGSELSKQIKEEKLHEEGEEL
jgi:hypothetical protein